MSWVPKGPERAKPQEVEVRDSPAGLISHDIHAHETNQGSLHVWQGHLHGLSETE